MAAGDPELTVEATGETVADAKAEALRLLERRVRSLDADAVSFQVVSEGKRGLLGVGAAPARVVASVAGPPQAAPVDESPRAATLRAVLERVSLALGIDCGIEVVEDESSLRGTCTGGDLGLLIGKHGQTIDAVQVLASAILAGSPEERKDVVVDAEGYRERRRRTLEALAVRCAEQALRDGARVELESMSAAERKLVHESLADYDGVTTSSEGDEPHRYVVVSPG